MTILSRREFSYNPYRTNAHDLAREKRSWFWRFVAHRPRCFALLLFHAHVDHVGTRLPQERPRVLAVEFVADRRDRNRFVGR